MDGFQVQARAFQHYFLNLFKYMFSTESYQMGNKFWQLMALRQKISETFHVSIRTIDDRVVIPSDNCKINNVRLECHVDIV